MKSDPEIIKLVKKQKDHSKRGLSRQFDNTILCQGWYNATDSTYEDVIQFEDVTGRRRKASVRFQKIAQNIDSVIGFMAQNRRQAKYIARVNAEQDQQIYSRNMNALYTFHRERMNADQIESRQDQDLVVNGYGAIDKDLSYIIGNATTDPNGEILGVNLDPMRVYWDATARAPNVMDRRYCGYYSDYELSDALDLFQGSKEEDFDQVSDDTIDDRAGYVYNPWGGLYDKIKLNNTVEWSAKEEDMVRVYNHQWFEYETFYKAKNPIYVAPDVLTALHAKARLDIIQSSLKSYAPDGINAGDTFDFDPSAEELIFDGPTKSKLVKEFGDLIQPVSFTRKCYYTAVISGDHVFTKFKSICQQGFSIQIKTGNYNERGKFWIGMVNAMIEPQKYYNKALTELMFTIAANSKGGVMVEEGAVEDIAEFEGKWAKTDAVIEVMPGAISGQKILQKAQGAVPTGLEGIIQLSDAAIAANGVDPAFLGQANDNETGVLYKRRIRQIISKMWWVADAITLFQKEDARLCADLIRIWVQNNAGEWLRITGKDGADQFVQISEDMMAPDYDVSIQEGAQTPEDQAETASFLGSIGDKYLAAGNQNVAGTFYAEAIGMLPLDGDIKNRMTTVLIPNQQMIPAQQAQQVIQHLQQQIQQLTSVMTQAQVDEIKSKTAVNMAKVPEIQAATMQKRAGGMKDIEDAHQKNIETQVLRTHASQSNINVTV